MDKIFIDPPINQDYKPPRQSANALFNFMGKISYLEEKIVSKLIFPRYNAENISFINDYMQKIAFPMICFCDININKLENHISDYGYFGIGFYKKWGTEMGIQPIHYINKCSQLAKDFRIAFNSAYSLDDNENPDYRSLKNYLISHLFFIKPISGIANDTDELHNFHDEKEWRYVPKINEQYEIPSVLPSERINPISINTLNNTIRSLSELSLKFEYKDIKYLIVDNAKSKQKIIETINSISTIEQEEKYELVSKIIVYDEIDEDW